MSAELDALDSNDKLDRSKARVQDLAEVFTPAHVVDDMLDLIPAEMIKPSYTWLEPTCGQGAFLKRILDRKLAYVEANYSTKEERVFRALEAVSSIYGIDISDVNVADSIGQMRSLFLAWHKRVIGKALRTVASGVAGASNDYKALEWILAHNIQVANTLTDKKISLISYKWEIDGRQVVLAHSFFGIEEVKSFDIIPYHKLYTTKLPGVKLKARTKPADKVVSEVPWLAPDM